jgi:hypothetical protein
MDQNGLEEWSWRAMRRKSSGQCLALVGAILKTVDCSVVVLPVWSVTGGKRDPGLPMLSCSPGSCWAVALSMLMSETNLQTPRRGRPTSSTFRRLSTCRSAAVCISECAVQGNWFFHKHFHRLCCRDEVDVDGRLRQGWSQVKITSSMVGLPCFAVETIHGLGRAARAYTVSAVGLRQKSRVINRPAVTKLQCSLI